MIEDNFPSGRPDWEAAGALFVDEVAPYEQMKLRMLNGAHSMLAYSGFLSGHRYVRDTMGDPELRRLIERHLKAAAETLEPLPGIDFSAYAQELSERFTNPSIAHETYQIAMDGSQKLPQRILGTIRDRMADGVMPEGLCLGVAAWMRYVGGFDEHGNAIDVRDPLAERLRALSDSAEGAEEKVSALLTVEDVFGTDLPRSEPFHNCVTRAYQRLLNDGAAVSVARFPETGP